MTMGGREADRDVRTRNPRTAAPLPPPGILLRRRRFARHLVAYVAVNLLVVAAWLIVGVVADRWFFWPIVVLVGWGLVLDVHAWWAYGRPSRSDSGQRPSP